MEPSDHPHIAGRSRYDPPPPPSQYLDPSYYTHPHHPHLHHPPFSRPLPPPLPLPRQHRLDHDRHHQHHHLEDESRYFPYRSPPDPFPLPLPRVPNRPIFPEDRPPLGHTHRSGRGEVFPQEPWEGGGFNVDRFWCFDERPEYFRLQWEQEARQGLPLSYRGDSYPMEDPGVAIAGSKRLRGVQDRDLEEGSGRRSQRQLGFWDDEGGHRRDLVFESVPPESPLASVPSSCPRSLRNFFIPDRRGDTESVTERRIPPPALMQSSGRSYSDRDLSANSANLGFDAPGGSSSYGFQENYFGGNKGKRKMPSGGNDNNLGRPPMKRPSALSRIQSGVSVWNRIEGKSSVSSPSSCPQLSPPEISDEHQLEMDTLDLSFKSNALVAKVVAPPSPVIRGSDEKSPEVTAPKKTVVKKKKLVKKRVKVVVPIVASPSVSKAKGGAPKRPLSSSPSLVSNNSEVSGKAIASSTKPVNDISPRTCPKRVIKMTSVDKNTGKRTAKAIASEELTKCANEVIPEAMHSDDTNPELSRQEITVMTASIENNAAEHPLTAAKLVEGGGSEDMKETEYVNLDEKDGQTCVGSVFEMGALHDASSQPCAQGEAIMMASLENGTKEELYKTFPSLDNDVDEDPNNQVTSVLDNSGKSTYPDNCVASFFTKDSSSYELGGNEQVVFSVGSITPIFGDESLKGKNVEGKTQREGKKQFIVGMATKELDISDGVKSKNDDASLRMHVQRVSAYFPSEAKETVLDQYQPDGTMHGEDGSRDLCVKDGPPQSDYLMLGGDHSPLSATCETLLGLSNRASSIVNSKVEDVLNCINAERSSQLLDSKGCSDNYNNSNNENEKPSTAGTSLLSSMGLLVSEAEEDVNSDKVMSDCHPAPEKTKVEALHDSRKLITVDSKVLGVKESMAQKTLLSSGVPKVPSSQASLASSAKVSARTSQNARHRTWHRNSTPPFASSSQRIQQLGGSSLCKQSPRKLGKLQTSYIRKGNSLIRKPAMITAPQPSYNNDNSTWSNPSFERPKTPPLPLGTKLPNCTASPSRETSRPLLENPISETSFEGQVRPLDLILGSVDSQGTISGKKTESLSTKRMVYVKRKSNQLVATPGPFGDMSNHSSEKAQMSAFFTSSDLYFKNKKNQLIRNAISTDSQQKQDLIVPTNGLNSEDQREPKNSSLNHRMVDLSKKRPIKVLQKASKHSRLSHVWTLSGNQLHRKGVSVLNCQVLPYLFPWKRTLYWKRRSLSLITRKLQLSRKRDTIYKVSNDGFSLRKAGVLSIGGSSLKWSRSIDRRSKKANEEATLAVAEVERKKRERKRRMSIRDGEKNGNSLLHEQSSFATDQQSSDRSQISLVPKRLLIGNDEYIRIGNGNQLVRDPKKLVRILASEKVRWSLHTARLRVARKQQYCQFFTRFGKCNKNGGKCPFIHDPAKVAICTKFLKGLCSSTNCKLTHKVLPERMPDCSYFLRVNDTLAGLCTNTNCPYRHINVNCNASICEGFLRGYCADGDEVLGEVAQEMIDQEV
ncbi:putative Zinc finger CCCH domain-containing protein 7 [Cocos nucifera]|uniref:Putative Zinc finger CCCH domain-containing protein 7 n=1 Tax=Cocos nucifera TaxID=13894 RepID=A0A8K0HVZ7_COCNU|nr:putative Zinc finger CCCH domain-containing protein 7 [Cocos nucifera]